MTQDFETWYKMSDREMLFCALNKWRNHIQTGDVNMSSIDAELAGMQDKVKMLNSDQQEFVTRLEELLEDVLNNKPIGV